LSALGLEDKFRRVGAQYMGLCILCEGDRESLGINTEKQSFNYFRCKRSGNVLEFVAAVKFGAKTKGQYVKEAAIWLNELLDNEGEAHQEGSGEAPPMAAAPVEHEPEAVVVPEVAGILELTERERLLLATMTRGGAVLLCEMFGEMGNREKLEARLRAKVKEQEAFFRQTND
jgi:hypothetical protein